MKRFLAAFSALCLLLIALPARAAAPEVSAAAAIVVDADSGRVLFAKNENEERAIASITKLMTGLVAVESTQDLDQKVPIKREYTLAEGSSMCLKVGEELTLRDLLYGLMLASGNDAALAIADFCAGDVARFVEWMNQKAAELGMEHSRFSNPHGLPCEEHYSTASDMAKLARVVMDNEVLAEIVGTKSITLGTRTLTNHNKLLWQYEGCIGLKTGYTDKAGRTLVTCVQKEEQRLICVTLGAPNDWKDHQVLYDYAFAAWPNRLLATAGKDIRTLPVDGALVRFVPVCTESAVYYPLSVEEQVIASFQLPERVTAPVKKGAIAGSLTFTCNGEIIGSTYLVYSQSVQSDRYEPDGFLARILYYFQREKASAVRAAFYRFTLQGLF